MPMVDCGFCTTLQISSTKEDVEVAVSPKSPAPSEEAALTPQGPERCSNGSPNLESIAEVLETQSDPSGDENQQQPAQTGEITIVATTDKGQSVPPSITELEKSVLKGAQQPEAIVAKTEEILAAKKPMDEILVTKECDFDTNPTDLYIALQRKDWDSSLECITKDPAGVSTWVSRKELDGRLRWRLLPIHGAIVFNAPEEIISALLAVYPEGAQAKDDQGMVPLHLSLRVGSPETVIGLLLATCPDSVEIKDRKGRTPRALAQAAKSPKRETFLRALDRGPTSAVVAATERAAEAAEQRAVFHARISEIRKNYDHMIQSLRRESESKQAAFERKIAELEAELEKAQETSQVLVDHITSLEAQLNSRTETERFLATKIATLDSDLKNTSRTKEEVESTYQTELRLLIEQRGDLENKARELRLEKETAIKTMEKALHTAIQDRKQFQEAYEAQSKAFRTMETDYKGLKSDNLLLEDQMRKRSANERSLAEQVSALAQQVALAARENGRTTEGYTSRVHNLEQEREDLRMTVNKLTKKLYNVAGFLNEIVQGQEAVIQQVAAQEKELSALSTEHALVMAEVHEQEQLLLKVMKEHDGLLYGVQRQAENIEAVSAARVAVLSAVQEHEKQMEVNAKDRRTLVRSVSDMKNQLIEAMDSMIGGLPRYLPDEELLVDRVVVSVLSVDNCERTPDEIALRAAASEFSGMAGRKIDEEEVTSPMGSSPAKSQLENFPLGSTPVENGRFCFDFTERKSPDDRTSSRTEATGERGTDESVEITEESLYVTDSEQDDTVFSSKTGHSSTAQSEKMNAARGTKASWVETPKANFNELETSETTEAAVAVSNRSRGLEPILCEPAVMEAEEHSSIIESSGIVTKAEYSPEEQLFETSSSIVEAAQSNTVAAKTPSPNEAFTAKSCAANGMNTDASEERTNCGKESLAPVTKQTVFSFYETSVFQTNNDLLNVDNDHHDMMSELGKTRSSEPKDIIEQTRDEEEQEGETTGDERNESAMPAMVPTADQSAPQDEKFVKCSNLSTKELVEEEKKMDEDEFMEGLI